MKKKIVSVLVSFLMALCLFPAAAFAADEDQAKIGSVSYPTLQAAIAAVPKDGTECTIQMIADVTVNLEEDVGSAGHYWYIGEGQNIVLDLNGHAIAVNEKVVQSSDEAFSYAVFENYGTLVVDDSSNGKKGSITFTHPYYKMYNAEATDYLYNIARNDFSNHGDLTINNGFIKQDVFQDIAIKGVGTAMYTVDNYNGGTFTMTGGELYNFWSNAIRQGYYGSGENVINITGGTVSGFCPIWLQTFAAGEKLTLNISGGTFNSTDKNGGLTQIYNESDGTATEINISGGTFNDELKLYAGTCSISGGTFNEKCYLHGNTEITGGVFEKGFKSWLGYYAETAQSMAIKGGEFNDRVEIYDYYGGGETTEISGGRFLDDVYAYYSEPEEVWHYTKCITGGVFAKDRNGKEPYEWIYSIHPDYIEVWNEDPETKKAYPYTVGRVVAQYWFTHIDGGRWYYNCASLQDAFYQVFDESWEENYPGASNKEIVLLEDIVLTEDVIAMFPYAEQTKFTLDLNGYTIETAGNTIYISDPGVSLTVKNGTIQNNSVETEDLGNHSVFKVTDGAELILEDSGSITTKGVKAVVADNAHFVMTGGSVSCTEYEGYDTQSAVEGKNGAVLDISAGTISCTGAEYEGLYGIYAQTGTTLNLGAEGTEGPEINSYYAAVATNGSTAPVSVNIYSGSYTASCDVEDAGAYDDMNVIKFAAENADGSSLTISGGRFVQEGSNESSSVIRVNYTAEKEITITGGEFVSCGNVFRVDGENTAIEVSGGWFSGAENNRIDESYVKSGYTVVADDTHEGCTHTVKEVKPVEVGKAEDFEVTYAEGSEEPDPESTEITEAVEEILENEEAKAPESTNIQTAVVSDENKNSQLKIELKALELDVHTIKEAAVITSNTAKYDVWPVFVVGEEETVISNAELAEILGKDGYVSFRLAVPDSMVGASKTVWVAHYPTVDEAEHTTAENYDWKRAYAVKGQPGAYYVDLQAREFSVYELSLTDADDFVAENQETGIRYTTLEEGLGEAKSGETVFLLKNIGGGGEGDAPEEKYVIVESGIILDLRGKSIVDAKLFYVTGIAKDSNKDYAEKGYVKAANYFFDDKTDERVNMPIYDASVQGYRLIELKFSSYLTAPKNGHAVFNLANNAGTDALLALYAANKTDTTPFTDHFRVYLDVFWINEQSDGTMVEVTPIYRYTVDFVNSVFGDTDTNNRTKYNFTADIMGFTGTATVQPRFVACDDEGNPYLTLHGPKWTIEGD